MERPSDVLYLPPIFMDGGRPPAPLLEGSEGLKRYASPSYSFSDLRNLRVEQLSEDVFLQLLRQFVKSNSKAFKRRTAAWHCKVAKAILITNKISDVKRLSLIPLRTERWIAASTGHVYFPRISGGTTLPTGIHVNIIHDTAARDRPRRDLYRKLGARDLHPEEVYELIVGQHSKHGSKYGEWDEDSVISHAWYLFTAPSKPENVNVRNLRVAAKDSELLYSGDELYMDANAEGMLLFEESGDDLVRFIHPRYFLDVPRRQKTAWRDWLSSYLGVGTLPRLLSKGDILSDEFKWLIERKPSAQWLTLLRDNWAHYEAEIVSGFRPARIWDALGNTMVSSDTGKTRLGRTYLATAAILEEPLAEATVPLLVVDDEKDQRWLQLEALGLTVDPNLEFYLDVHYNIRTKKRIKFSLEDLRRIYNAIDDHFTDDPSSVKYGVVHLATKSES